MNKDLIQRLIAETTEEVLGIETGSAATEDAKQAVRLSALVTVKILEKLELIDRD